MAQHLSATGRLVPGRQSTPVDDRDPAAGLSQSAPRCTVKPGRRASRNAYPRGAWVRWCSRGRYRSSRSSVEVPWVTLCVTDLRRAAHSG
ncbi:hypothetical protein DND47_27670 [Pseudomonas syringae pv. syringae]|nr:hypothetical protein DND47_27670 [Pseudomonas syringae pv. syringae]